MTPLWIRANLPSLLTCGWAFASVTAPWVAHRGCPIPVVPPRRSLEVSSTSRSTRPAFLTTVRPPPRALGRRDPGGVVAAVLKALEGLQEDGRCLAFPDVAYDAAHGWWWLGVWWRRFCLAKWASTIE